MQERLAQIFGQAAPLSPGSLLYRHLLKDRASHSVLRWLGELDGAVQGALNEMVAGAPVASEQLEMLIVHRGGRYLLESCYRAGLLPDPVVRWDRIETFLRRVESEPPLWKGRLLRRYWQLGLRDAVVARRSQRSRFDPQLEEERRKMKVAHRFLQPIDSLEELQRVNQVQLDEYASAHGRGLCRQLRAFIAWLRENELVASSLAVPKGRRKRGARLTAKAFFAIWHRVIEDADLPLFVRVALVFVMIACKQLAEIVLLRESDVREIDDGVEVSFARGIPQHFEGSLAEFILDLRARARGWLFPNPSRPGEPHTSETLATAIHTVMDVNIIALRNCAIRLHLRDLEPDELLQILGLQGHQLHNWSRRHPEVDPSLVQPESEASDD